MLTVDLSMHTYEVLSPEFVIWEVIFLATRNLPTSGAITVNFKTHFCVEAMLQTTSKIKICYDKHSTCLFDWRKAW